MKFGNVKTERRLSPDPLSWAHSESVVFPPYFPPVIIARCLPLYMHKHIRLYEFLRTGWHCELQDVVRFCCSSSAHLTQARATWEGECQLRKCPHQRVYRQALGAHSWLMIDVRGSGPLWTLRNPGLALPDCVTKPAHQALGSKLVSSR